GMGLERLAVVVQDVDSVFDIDTMKAIRDHICELAGVKYQAGEGKKQDNAGADKDVSIRLITDHIRSATFLISDGVMPSNEGRGYVLRRIIRRAARHGRLLGIEGAFLAGLAETVIRESGDGYPELIEKKEFILNVLTQEENKFNKTIDQGLSILNDFCRELEEKGIKELDGRNAFKLHDTYGFPLDLTREILMEKGLSVDEAGFMAAMKEQKDNARKARKTTNYMGADATVYEQIDKSVTSEFIGYDRLKADSVITALTTEEELADALADGDRGTIIVPQTPFYATMGGQSGDTGIIVSEDGENEFLVEDTVKLTGNRTGHIGRMTKGMFKLSDRVTLMVNEQNRERTCKNHSATHLLQKALRTVLGSHVEQAGSFVNGDRLRFDFSHFAAMTEEELSRTENMVNEAIASGLCVDTEIMSLEEARKTGAMALFGEKYGEKVRVVRMGDFSVELCGGTHVKNTSEISAFKILSEAGIAAGVRRIEAITGSAVYEHYREEELILKKAGMMLKTAPSGIIDRIAHLQEEIKSLSSELESLKSKAANDALGDLSDRVKEIKGLSFISARVKDVDMNGLRELGDRLKGELKEGVVVLASDSDGKVNLMVMATEGAVRQGAHAGNLIKAIAGTVGGGGGGRPNMAQAGGKDPSGIDKCLAEAEKALEGMLG
ncbi:MAG TPA: alanine--tRNA ligase, partial [Lachnospiraceae bacterium]|nr:alanine--tRNA ligase [Lachnospiraceae bacterium]